MAKVTRPHPISSTITEDEKVLLDKLDEVLPESRAEFIRRVVIREARKILNKKKV